MRKLEIFVRKYGPDAGPKLFHALQSQAAHAGVSARLRRKIDILMGRVEPEPSRSDEDLPLFPDAPEPARAEDYSAVAVA